MLSKKGLLRVTIFVFQTNYNFKMLITPERKVPQRSDASQNDHNSKGYPAKTSAAKVGYRRQYPTFASGFLLDFLKSGSTALIHSPFSGLKFLL